eukprot:8920960-Alexandrium_andersonii.AAC.1
MFDPLARATQISFPSVSAAFGALPDPPRFPPILSPHYRKRALLLLGRTPADGRARLAEPEPRAGSSPRPPRDS